MPWKVTWFGGECDFISFIEAIKLSSKIAYLGLDYKLYFNGTDVTPNFAI
jgi:hypothetical protein